MKKYKERTQEEKDDLWGKVFFYGIVIPLWIVIISFFIYMFDLESAMEFISGNYEWIIGAIVILICFAFWGGTGGGGIFGGDW